MDDPRGFVDRCGEVGIGLPAPVAVAVDRWRMIERALRDLAVDPLAGVDLATVAPADAELLVRRVIRAQIEASHAHSPAATRLHALATAEVKRAILGSAGEIMGPLRQVHDGLARRLTTIALLLNGIGDSALPTAAPEVRAAWLDRPSTAQEMRAVRGLREDLAAVGYRLDYRDELGRELERLTRFVDVPPDITPDRLRRWLGFAAEHDFVAVLGDGGRWWLPSLAEQGERVEALRTAWANRDRPVDVP